MEKRISIDYWSLKDEEVRRVAEILDEGCYINAHRNKKGIYVVSVRVRRAESDDIEFLRDTVGGYYSEQEKGGEKFYWVNYQEGLAVELLNRVGPLLRKRLGSYKLVLKLRKSIQGNGRKRLSDLILEYRQRLIDELKQENKDFFGMES